MIALSIKLKEAEKMALKLRASRLGFRNTTAYLRALAQDELSMLNQLAESSKFTS